MNVRQVIKELERAQAETAVCKKRAAARARVSSTRMNGYYQGAIDAYALTLSLLSRVHQEEPTGCKSAVGCVVIVDKSS